MSFIANAFRYAADSNEAAAALIDTHPYSIYVVNVANPKRKENVTSPRVRTDTRITVSGGVGIDGYSPFAPGDGYMNPGVSILNTQYQRSLPTPLQGMQFSDRVYAIGPVILPYTQGAVTAGWDPLMWDPPVVQGNTPDVFTLIYGPSIPATGHYCKLIKVISDDNVTFMVYVENTGTQVQ